MKTFLLLAGIGILPTLALAQTEKGQGIWTGSASFGYSHQSNKQFQNEFFSHSPQGSFMVSRGVFFKDNWLAGGGLSADLAANRSGLKYPNQQDIYKFSSLNTGLNAFVRRYWGKEKWRIFLGGGLSLNYSRSNFDGANIQNPDANTFSIAPIAQVGANYYLTDRLGLEASLLSNSFPFSASGASIGLVILTGVKNAGSPELYEAPQTAKGRWIVGGSFSFSTQGATANQPRAEEQRSSTFTLSPSVGWFIAKNLLLGASIPLSLNSDEDGSTSSYGIKPYLKKYISDNRLRPFVEGGLSYVSTLNKLNAMGSTNSTTQLAGISASAGLAYLLGNRFIVEAELGGIYLNKQFYSGAPSFNVWSGGASASLQPAFTINYVFD